MAVCTATLRPLYREVCRLLAFGAAAVPVVGRRGNRRILDRRISRYLQAAPSVAAIGDALWPSDEEEAANS